jgi:hypothetical protein
MDPKKLEISEGTDGITPGRENASAPGPLKPNGQHSSYWVLREEERKKGFVRPVRRTYVHERCGVATTMAQSIAETYAREPDYYGSTFCVGCRGHFPVGPHGEFHWDDESKVGS